MTSSLQIAATCALLILLTELASADNLTCYQCTRNTNVECDKKDLLPCPTTSDRCVTHISKDETKGFTIKRECGLGPCTFNDIMMDKGLGFDNCDTSKDHYFCLFCCKGNGCNKNSSAGRPTISWLLILTLVALFLLDVVKNYQPPYLTQPDV